MDAIDLLAWRGRLGLTQREAADRLGVALGTYRNWEQGRRTHVPWALLERACRDVEGRVPVTPVSSASIDHNAF